MTYEWAMGVEPETQLCTVDEIRAAYLSQLEEDSQSSAPAVLHSVSVAREALELTDEQLAARRDQARQEEERLREELRGAQGNTALEQELRDRLNMVMVEQGALRDDWSRRDRERRYPEMCARDAQQREEVANMWTSGQWRDYDVYTRWLEQSFRGFYMIPLKSWFGSAHCALLGPTEVSEGSFRCAGHAPANRLKAAVVALLPFATGYYAWRKKQGSLPWTAAGVAAGVVGPTLLYWLLFGAMLATVGAPRY